MSLSSTANPVASSAPIAPTHPATDEAMAPLRAAKDRWSAIHAAIQLARSIPPGERRAWLEGARFRHPDPLVVEMFAQELQELLFQQDPYALVAAQISAENPWANVHLPRLAKLDPEKLIAIGQAAGDPAQGRRMIFAGMNELVARDPATVLKLALEFPPPADGKELPKDMLRLLAKASAGDAEKLLDLADARGDRWRSLLRAAAAQTAISKNFAQGLQWIAAQPDNGELFNALFRFENGQQTEEAKANTRQIAESLASLSPEFVTAVRRASSRGEWPGFGGILGVEDLWLDADLERLGFDADEQHSIRASSLQNLLLRDPASIAKYLADPAFLDPGERKAFLSELEGVLARGTKSSMPPEVLAALSEEERKILSDAEAKFRSKEPQAPKKLQSVPEQIIAAMNEKGSDAMHLRTSDWGSEQMDEAIGFIRSAKPEVQAEMVRRILRTGGPPLPLAAEIYLLALVNNTATPKVREELIETSIHWASRQPQKAAAWVESLPTGPERLCSIRNVAAQWNAGDPSGASAWIATLKDAKEAEAAKDAIRIYTDKTKLAK